MAYVAISQSLINSVRNKIRSMWSAELGTIPEDMYVFNGDDQFFVRQFWKEYAHLWDKVPHEWCDVIPDSHARVCVTLTNGTAATVDLGIKFEPPARLVPTGMCTHDGVKLTDSPNVKDGEALRLVELARKFGDISTRWGSVEAQLLKFLQACKSLNEAVKLWPQIEAYVPPHIMEQMRQNKKREVTKSKAAEVLDTLDTDEIVSSAVIARLSK